MTLPFTVVFTGDTLVIVSAAGVTNVTQRRDDPGRFEDAVCAMASIINLAGGPRLEVAPQDAHWVGALPAGDRRYAGAPAAPSDADEPGQYGRGFQDGLLEVQEALDDDPDMPFVEWTGDATLYDAGWYKGWCHGFAAIKALAASRQALPEEDVEMARVLRETQGEPVTPGVAEPVDLGGDTPMDEYTRFILAAAHEAGIADIAGLADRLSPP